MKVFISWSGSVSRQLGEAVRRWLPSALHAVKPYFTPDDIEKGTRWGDEISKELDSSDFGVICLTRENLERPWIMFEAGALTKKFQVGHVCPILFGLDKLPLQGPLAQFQAAKFTKRDFKRLFKTINGLCGDHRLEQDVLDDVFEMWWPRLESQVQGILSQAEVPGVESEPPSQEQMLTELLNLTRMNIDLTKLHARGSGVGGHSRTYSRLSREIHHLNQVCSGNAYEEAVPAVQRLARVAHRIIEGNAPGLRRSLAILERIGESGHSEETEEPDS